MNEITREEIKFSRFIERLQRRFKYFLLDPFMTINKLDGIPEQYCNPDLFNVFFTKSNLFKEYKEMELLDARLSILSSISQYIWDPTDNPKGIFSRDFVVKRYFRMPDEEYLENKAMLEEAVKFQKKKAKEEAKRNAESGIQPETEDTGEESAPEEEAVTESIRNFGHKRMLIEDKSSNKISMVDTWKKHMSMLEENITSQLKHK
jgi:predicted metal-binding transcription factor (methanogenesis marker protein 9)